ncbi:O-antigen/teichoic acid export membrane protein [Deinococcus metalli]|uniref:O-antigen/teichoic acid export membrane protein n=1 Tax=Deinococcus metalli TaxID=1141878 RepID=A0A7W8KCP5_9DEIO|nr:oligosaccharide flippase family protein [Deinococcus metalli]MBB5375775.1 O-antigen/teichoic acid export membrane protein [Deinococcus metalli]
MLLGSTSMLGARVFSVLASLISVGILTRALGREEFGLWSIIGTFVGFAGSFDFGLGQGLRNRLAAAVAQQPRDNGAEAQLFFSVLAFLTFIALVLASVLGGLALMVPWATFLGVHAPALAGPAQAASVAVIVLLALNLPLSLNVAGFLAYQDAARRGLLDVLQSAALLIGVVVLARALPIATFIGAYYVLFDGAALVSLIVFLRLRGWRVPYLHLKPILTVVREIAAPSALFWLLGIGAVALFTTDPLIAARLIGIGAAGDFSIVQKIAALLIGMHFTILTPLWSAYTHAAVTGDWRWIRRSFQRSVTVTVVLFGCGGGLAILLHGPLLKLWTGRELTDVPLMVALAVWAMLYALVNCCSVLLNGLGIIGTQLIAVCLGALVHVPLSLALGQRFGVIGVLYGTIAVVVPILAATAWRAHRVLRAAPRD